MSVSDLANINLEEEWIFVKDTKNKRNRHAYITAEIRAMLTNRYQGQSKTEQVFNPEKAKFPYQTVMDNFRQAIADLGLNDGITDRRQKLVFHSLRHTFASWLVGADGQALVHRQPAHGA